MSSDNKERTLNNLKNDSEFSLLIDELVLCVGVAKRREDGSIEFTGFNQSFQFIYLFFVLKTNSLF